MQSDQNQFAAGPTPAAVYWLGDLPSRILAVVSCVMLFFMMGFSFADVMGRYLFNNPLPAAYEIISLTMPAVIFCALPLTNRREGHVTIDLLDTFVPSGMRRAQAIIVDVFAGGATGFVAWRLAMRSVDHHRFFGVTDELYLPLWPFSAVMSVLCGVAALAFVANVIEKASGGALHDSYGGPAT